MAFALCLVDPRGYTLAIGFTTDGKLCVTVGEPRDDPEREHRWQALEEERVRNVEAIRLAHERERRWQALVDEHDEWLRERRQREPVRPYWCENTQHRAYSSLSHARVTPHGAQEVNRLTDQRQNRSQRIARAVPTRQVTREPAQRRQLCGRPMRALKQSRNR